MLYTMTRVRVKLSVFIIVCCCQFSSCSPVHSDSLSPLFLSEENKTIAALEMEAKKTGFPFQEAWKISELEIFYKLYRESEGVDSKDLKAVYRENEILNLGEIRILISYCYKEPPFYQDLNKDLREEDGKKYPEATRILKDALYKLRKHQEGTNQALPSLLFRNEPKFLFDRYKVLLEASSQQGVLTQFTSSSRSAEKARKFIEGPDRMIIVFENPEVGGDVDDFSIFDEFEVLLPVKSLYDVKRADLVNGTEDVILVGPTSSQNWNKLNIELVIMCLLGYQLFARC